MIKAILTNEILKYITEIEKNRYRVSTVKMSRSVADRLRKNSKKKSSYASNKIEGNPLSEKQVDEVIDRDERKHFLKPEQEVRNYFLALNYLEEKAKKKEKFSKKLILDVQKYVEKGASKEKIGLRGPMPPGVLFAVYDSQTGNPDYIPPEYSDIPGLLDELVEYVNTTDDHPLKELLLFLMKHYKREFTPIEVSKEFAVTNKTIINRLSVLVKNGFVEPIMVNERIRSYRLSNFTKDHEKELKKAIQ